jgi:hypothetical protein
LDKPYTNTEIRLDSSNDIEETKKKRLKIVKIKKSKNPSKVQTKKTQRFYEKLKK